VICDCDVRDRFRSFHQLARSSQQLLKDFWRFVKRNLRRPGLRLSLQLFTMENRSIWSRLYAFKVHHIILWLAYFLFWISFYSGYYSSVYPLVVNTSIYFIFTASAFYTTAYFLFPRYLYQNRYGTFSILFILLVILLSAGLAIILFQIYNGYDPAKANFPAIFQISFMSIAMTVCALSAVKLMSDKIKTDRKNRLMDKQRLESELQYLKAQVNPHFLFNAINSVYFLIKKNPNQAAETLIKLSDLLRFQLYDCSGESIAIEKELEYLNNFIALEKIRKGEKVKVSFETNGNLSGFEIAPFLVIPFLENAFKYISNFNNKENRIGITIAVQNNVFEVSITNTTDNIANTVVGGIGLKNVKRRLELLYPGKHRLAISDNAGEYSVFLSLTIS
jgi:two-component system LytT family sensor kinase